MVPGAPSGLGCSSRRSVNWCRRAPRPPARPCHLGPQGRGPLGCDRRRQCRTWGRGLPAGPATSRPTAAGCANLSTASSNSRPVS